MKKTKRLLVVITSILMVFSIIGVNPAKAEETVEAVKYNSTFWDETTGFVSSKDDQLEFNASLKKVQKSEYNEDGSFKDSVYLDEDEINGLTYKWIKHSLYIDQDYIDDGYGGRRYTTEIISDTGSTSYDLTVGDDELIGNVYYSVEVTDSDGNVVAKKDYNVYQKPTKEVELADDTTTIFSQEDVVQRGMGGGYAIVKLKTNSTGKFKFVYNQGNNSSLHTVNLIQDGENTEVFVDDQGEATVYDYSNEIYALVEFTGGDASEEYTIGELVATKLDSSLDDLNKTISYGKGSKQYNAILELSNNNDSYSKDEDEKYVKENFKLCLAENVGRYDNNDNMTTISNSTTDINSDITVVTKDDYTEYVYTYTKEVLGVEKTFTLSYIIDNDSLISSEEAGTINKIDIYRYVWDEENSTDGYESIEEDDIPEVGLSELKTVKNDNKDIIELLNYKVQGQTTKGYQVENLNNYSAVVTGKLSNAGNHPIKVTYGSLTKTFTIKVIVDDTEDSDNELYTSNLPTELEMHVNDEGNLSYNVQSKDEKNSVDVDYGCVYGDDEISIEKSGKTYRYKALKEGTTYILVDIKVGNEDDGYEIFTRKIKLTVDAATHAHQWDEGVISSAATCVSKGKTKYNCTVEGCNSTKEEENIPINPENHTGETYIDQDSIIPATCNQDGYSGNVCCSGCNKKLSNGTSITQLSHKISSEPEMFWYQEMENGEKVYECSYSQYCMNNCGYEIHTTTSTSGDGLETEGVEKGTKVVDTVEATCTKNGSKKYTATFNVRQEDGTTKTSTCTKEIILPATGHTFNEEYQNDQTCETNGTIKKTCTKEGCGYVEYVVDTAHKALGHQWDGGVEQADGTILYTCNRTINGKQCGKTIKCGKVEVGSITISKKSTTINVGSHETITATAKSSSGTTLSEELMWKSSNENVAKVEDGKITAIKTGEAVITAYSQNGTTNTCKVTVVKKATNLLLSATEITLNKGESQVLSVSAVTPEDTTDTISYKSLNTRVASVTRNGLIIAKSKGTATIVVACGNVTKTCEVTVNATGISLNYSKLVLEKDEVSSVIYQSTNNNISYYVDTSGVVDIDYDQSTGNYTVKAKKVGKCKVIFTDGETTDSCEVVVRKPVETSNMNTSISDDKISTNKAAKSSLASTVSTMIKEVMEDEDSSKIDTDTLDKVNDALSNDAEIVTTIDASTKDEDSIDEITASEIKTGVKNDTDAVKFVEININLSSVKDNVTTSLGSIKELSDPIVMTYNVEDADFDDLEYYVLRDHDGEVQEISATKNDDGTISFETDKFSTYGIVAHKHNWESEFTVDKAPTCGKAGKKSIHCKLCDKTKDIETIPATGNHQYDNGVVTKEATTTSEGIKTYTCKVCGNTYTEAIDKLPNSKQSGASTNVVTLANKATSTVSTVVVGDTYTTENNATVTVLSNTTVSLKNKTVKTKQVSVPESITVNGKEYKVTTIKRDCFNGATVTKASLPTSITKIAYKAFAGDKKLRVININSKKLTVSKDAFKGLKKSQVKKIKVTVCKKFMSKANYKKLRKQLIKAGIKASNIQYR